MAELYCASLGVLDANLCARLDKTAKAEQAQLALLAASFNREIQRCSARLEYVSDETLWWLAGINPTKPAPRLFGLKQEASLMK